MKVLILGANANSWAMVVKILKDDHEIIETDLEQIDTIIYELISPIMKC